ncbi:hypothetical protein [Streptomyces sp. NBC_00645]|uniref:hypothetical protein n=1 Tax=Streptomyces sp. NBC_00645 TaxID=2975795 RepID=UPI00324F3F49
MPGLVFTLTGRDELSDVFDDIGDAARRMGRRLHAASMDADRDIRRFTRDTSDRMAGMRRDTEAGGKAIEELSKVTKLISPAAIPAAAAMVPLAAGAATVGVAVLAMTAAMAPQIAALGDASTAQKAYEDAVAKSGARSQEAIAAQAEYVRVVSKLPQPTREAAAAVGILKDDFADWSDSLAGDTMAPFIKGVAITNALLPKTSGLVKAASAGADRFMTIVGGEMSSPGLDRLNTKFTNFANKTIRGVNDEIVHLLRTSNGGGGEVGGKLSEFMTWARAQGPTVASVLTSVATALLHVLQAGSDVGVGLLQVIEVAAKLVSAVPPEAIGMFLQLALALKITKAAALGMAAGRTALAMFGTQLVAMRTAAAATPGALAAARAAIMALSRTAKVAIAGTGIGLLIIGLTELAQRGRSAPPDVDKLTSSLKELGSTGHVTGEASKAFGADLSGLYDKVRSLTDPSTTDKVQQFLVGWTGWDSTPVKEAKENIGAIDEALANLVKGGQSELAASALKHLTAEYAKGGRDTKDLTGKLDDYKSALADAEFEQQLAAESMGLFGTQAQNVQAKLNAQKQSADGLRQSLQALNDVQRAGLGGMIGFEASIDAASKAAKDNAGALSMSGGQLNLNSEKARNAASALNDLAAKTDEASSQARESGASWETVNGIYARGRKAFIDSAQAMGLNKKEAAQLADQILKIPDKKAKFEMDTEDAGADLDRFIGKMKKSPDSKSVTLKTLSKAAEDILTSFGYKVVHMKDGSVKITAKTGAALSGIGAVQRARNALTGKTIYFDTIKRTYFETHGRPGQTVAAAHRPDLARGGPVRGYAGGGSLQFFPNGGPISGPGTPTSDSILARFASGATAGVSNTEFVVKSASVSKYGIPLLTALNDGRLEQFLAGRGLAGGGTAGAGAQAGHGLAQGLLGSRGTVGDAARAMASAVETGIRDELEIRSPSKKTKALMADVGKGMIIGLTGTRAKIKSTAKDLAKDIWTAFSGSKDNRLVAYVNKETSKLLAAAKKRDVLEKKIAEAKAFAKDITRNAREGAGLSNLGMEPENVTAGGIKAGLAGKLAQIKQFTRYVDILAKKGLNKSLLRQILNMGPEAGYAYASALVGADKGTFKGINSLQSQVDKSSTKLGRLGADRMYDSGKNASKGFLKGLESQEKALEDLMEKIAKSMQKALRKALGIKSPARKLIPDGVNTARGIAVGVIAGLPYVDRAMDALSGRVIGRATIPPTAGRGVTGSRGGPDMHVQVDIHGALDPIATAKEFQKILLKLKRDQGMSVSLGVG